MKTIEDYMNAVRANVNNDEYLASINCSPYEKDMGYMSALRYLKIQRTDETDELATALIYSRPLPDLRGDSLCQLQLKFRNPNER